MMLARCLPACNAPLRLDIEPAVTMPVIPHGRGALNQYDGWIATLRPERIVMVCSHCGSLREHHRVLDEQEIET